MHGITVKIREQCFTPSNNTAPFKVNTGTIAATILVRLEV